MWGHGYATLRVDFLPTVTLEVLRAWKFSTARQSKGLAGTASIFIPFNLVAVGAEDLIRSALYGCEHFSVVFPTSSKFMLSSSIVDVVNLQCPLVSKPTVHTFPAEFLYNLCAEALVMLDVTSLPLG